MDEMTVFEQRFEGRVRIFALSGVRPVDSGAVAHAVAVGQPRDRWTGSSVRWLGLPLERRVWTVADALGLLVALLGGALLVGARLLQPPLLNMSPTVTNGWIAFAVAQEGTIEGGPDTDIWIAALDEPARRVVGTDTDSVDQACPAFSPDGERLAYGSVEGIRSTTAYRSSALVIAEVAVDGTVAERLTVDVGPGLPPPCPVWSPDGDQLAFGVPLTSPINPRGSGEGSEVWILRPADGHITVIRDLLATDLEWSPDGSALAIVGGVETASGAGVVDGLQDARIHLYEPSTGTMRTLDDTLGGGGVTWSPDGTRIAYVGDGLRIIDVETGQQEILTDTFSANHGLGPVWSPDGNTIAYQRTLTGTGEKHEVVLVTPADRSAQTGLANEVVMPTERTTADGSRLTLYPWRVIWSPDGTYLLYVAWTYPDDAVERTWVVAVPTDRDAPAVLVADIDGIAAYDFSDDTMRVPIQVWGRSPSD